MKAKLAAIKVQVQSHVWEMFQDNKEPLFLADDFDPYAVVKFNLLETSVRDLCHGLGYALKPPKQRGTMFDLRRDCAPRGHVWTPVIVSKYAK